MAPREIAQFYYGSTLPARAIAIAHVTAEDASPADLIDVVNQPYQSGNLGIWKVSSGVATLPDFTAPDFSQSVQITGDVSYLVHNQFFELTNQFATDGTPLYFVHNFGQAVTGASVLNLDGTVMSPAPNVKFTAKAMYHDIALNRPCRIRYVDSAGRVQTSLLHYTPVLGLSTGSNVNLGYSFAGGVIAVASSTQIYAIRFTAQNGYKVLPPYAAPSYLPWFPRVRFGVRPPALEYQAQNFLPIRPYMLGYWVPGQVLSHNLIGFDRPRIYSDTNHLPDILVFDAEGRVKYAMDGSGSGQPDKHGTLYNWKRRQISAVDWYTGRVEVIPQLDPTDIVYGFYSYFEPDFIYTALDVNPVTNPAVRNTVIVFYYRTDSDPLREVFHQVFTDAGPVAGLTNDPAPPTWTGQSPSAGTVFAEMVVGVSFGISTFEVTDARTRGGGLAPQYQTIAAADNFWDLGYLDGRPYPVAGALVVYLPSTILESMTREVIVGKVNAALPMGTLAVLRFYDPQSGEELV